MRGFRFFVLISKKPRRISTSLSSVDELRSKRKHEPVLRVGANDLKPITIDPPGERVPEAVPDHPAQSVDWVLRQTGLVEDDSLSAVVSCEGEFL
jgi:hypothetical protein